MVLSKRRKQTSPPFSYKSPSARPSWSRRKRSFQQWLFDLAIAALSVLVIGFIISAITTRSGIQLTFTSGELTDRSRMLAATLGSDAYEASEELADDRIGLEVLNGLGVIGLADQFTSYQRDQGFDGVRFTNAHRFDYPRTLVINRGDDFEQARLVAQSLGLETGAVENMPDPSLQLDVTVVLGQDYATLTSYRTIMARIR